MRKLLNNVYTFLPKLYQGAEVEEYNEVMKSEIAVTRRTTYRAEENVGNLEKSKKK